MEAILLILLIIIIVIVLCKNNKIENLPNLVKLPANYVHCAHENEQCNITEPTQVYYGADDKYYAAQMNGAFDCQFGLFGDPNFGVNKACYVPRPTPESEVQPEIQPEERPDTIILAPSYMKCSDENQMCNATGVNNAIYGANGRYIVKKIIGGFECNNTIFGTDPNPTINKSCYVPAT